MSYSLPDRQRKRGDQFLHSSENNCRDREAAVGGRGAMAELHRAGVRERGGCVGGEMGNFPRKWFEKGGFRLLR